MQPEMLADYACVCGENPLWHPLEKRVYWTDIDTGRLFRYDPASGRHEQIYQGVVVGGFTIQADGALLLFMARGAVKLWRNGQLSTVIPELPEELASRFNDVIADPAGRVFCGTMRTPQRLGRLYRLDPGRSIRPVLEGIGTSNGMGFTLDRKRFYHTDSPTREISIFDYDQESGALTNRRLFVRTPENKGAPDGMTVDAEGCVWTAKWGGGCVVRYSPEGRELLRIEFPAKKVSCLTFGGDDYGDIYVTTAGGDKKDADGPGAGALFRVRAGVKGLPEFPSRIAEP